MVVALGSQFHEWASNTQTFHTRPSGPPAAASRPPFTSTAHLMQDIYDDNDQDLDVCEEQNVVELMLDSDG